MLHANSVVFKKYNVKISFEYFDKVRICSGINGKMFFKLLEKRIYKTADSQKIQRAQRQQQTENTSTFLSQTSRKSIDLRLCVYI